MRGTIQGKNRVREQRQHGSVRGVPGNRHPYRDQPPFRRLFRTWDIHDKDLSRKNTLLPALDGRVFRSAGWGPTNRATICRLRPVTGWVNVSCAVDCAEPAGPDIHLRERSETVHED